MGVDETNVDGNIQTRTNSSAALMKLAETVPGDSLELLLKKIDDLCIRGGDGKQKTAIRMEMCEIQGNFYLFGLNKIFICF